MESRQIRDDIVALIVPHVSSQSQREALVDSAFVNIPIRQQISLDGSASAFSMHLVTTALRYGMVDGKPVIHYLLDAVAAHYGEDKQHQIAHLKAEIEENPHQFDNLHVHKEPLTQTPNVGIWVLVIVLVVGGFGYLIVDRIIDERGQQMINQISNVNSFNNLDLSLLRIENSDSAAVIEAKQRATIAALSGDMNRYVRYMNSRLGLLDAVDIVNNAFDQQLENMRPPALQEMIGGEYDALRARQESTALREQWNDNPLPQEPIVGLQLVANNVDVEANQIASIFEQLNLVVDESGDVLYAIESYQEDSPEWASYSQQKLLIAQGNLETQSRYTYLLIMDLLYGLKDSYPDEVTLPSGLTAFEPVAREDIDNEMESVLAEMDDLIDQEAELVGLGEQLLQGDLDQYEQLIGELEISPEDSWEIVIGKAVSLRQLGYTEEAVTAFIQYGEMFTASDPTAEHYSETAIAFTQQINALGVTDGAVYLWSVPSGSIADEAGIQNGDIIIAINGNEIRDMCDFAYNLPLSVPQTCMELYPGRVEETLGDTIGITILRRDGDTFERLQFTVETADQIGLGAMPI